MDTKNKSLLTIKEVADMLEVTRQTVLRYILSGELKVASTSGLRNKRRLFSKADVIGLKKKYAN